MLLFRTNRDEIRPCSASGDMIILAFLIVQGLDGVLTYLGVTLFGPQVEGNPLVAGLITGLGLGPGLALAKMTAAGFGIMLHLTQVHRMIAALTAVYLTLAVLPWAGLLLFF